MNSSFYQQADVVICDPVVSNRANTRSALFALGYRRIEILSNLQDLAELLGQRSPDLLLCDAQLGLTELCRMVQDIRQGLNYANPFILILVTTWGATPELIRQVSEAGADDLLVRPFSTKRLSERVEGQLIQRKNFIITGDYIGPERRVTPRDVPSATHIDAPNTLAIRAWAAAQKGPDPSRRISVEVAAACKTFQIEMLKRDAAKLYELAKLSTGTASDKLGQLNLLLALAATIEKRAHTAGVTGWEGDQANLILAAAELKTSSGQHQKDALMKAAQELSGHFPSADEPSGEKQTARPPRAVHR
jgi:DNA-binding response OmpR family regulator